MKRVVLVALSVALFAGVASAQTPQGTTSLWIQPVGGGNQINLAVSETAIIQLWMNYSAPADGNERLMIGMDAQLDHRDVQGINFEVTGFNPQGPWGVGGTFYRFSRGQIDESPPDNIVDDGYTGVGNVDYYQFQGTVNPIGDPPYTMQTGLLPNQGDILLDEIIIHGASDSGTVSNRVIFAPDPLTPSWFEAYFYEGTYSYFTEYGFDMGTGINKNNPVYVHVTPEPASLALLAFGGLAAIRRRR